MCQTHNFAKNPLRHRFSGRRRAGPDGKKATVFGIFEPAKPVFRPKIRSLSGQHELDLANASPAELLYRARGT
jgi:hypothetical protein